MSGIGLGDEPVAEEAVPRAGRRESVEAAGRERLDDLLQLPGLAGSRPYMQLDRVAVQAELEGRRT